MATREDRMRQRLRGAVRHQVEDISFGFQIPGIENDDVEHESADQPSSPNHAASNTNSSTSRANKLSPNQPSATRGIENGSIQPTEANADPQQLRPKENERDAHHSSEANDDVLALLPPITSVRSFHTRRSQTTSDIVEESPVHAPGSGHRRSLQPSDVGNASAKLQSFLGSPNIREQETMISSPLARKSTLKISGHLQPALQASPLRRRSSQRHPTDDFDELSSQARRHSVDGELAEEINDGEAAKVLLGKRTRGLPAPGGPPTLEMRMGREGPLTRRHHQNTSPIDTRQLTTVAEEGPIPKRRKKKLSSPAKQKQPKPKKQLGRQHNRPRLEMNEDNETSADEMGAIDDAAVVPVTVQRFVRPRKLNTGEDADPDVLATDIPFSNQKGVNVIDVLSQSCEEVIGNCIDQLVKALRHEDLTSTRKELRSKLVALEDFADELRTKFLAQTIMLDNLHSLRRRVRDAEARRTKLRDSILDRRRERQEIQFQIDSERETHEENRKLLASRMDMSSNLHAVRLHVEQGKRESANLGTQHLQKASLTTLEFSLPQIADRIAQQQN
ncbi:hypothetical protein jhhlp_004477 [Lomentospora prolificans]|uniref:Inner kinetochore subunit AME1 domain-containing protein n=1 Tax=Lomentospora prolificans TaxID=41688 RepID=A0A2N3NBP0_9PEZI|nr:hypothetical protein jhhlp_004477 [Lomentospora prolificans]